MKPVLTVSPARPASRTAPVRSASTAAHPVEAPVLRPGDWRLPSGVGLADFALRGGFVAPDQWRRSMSGNGGRL